MTSVVARLSPRQQQGGGLSLQPVALTEQAGRVG